MSRNGWIGVDLDGTLAHYDGWQGVEHIGAPIPKMVERVQTWLREGKHVKIFTARISEPDPEQRAWVKHYIEQWCIAHIGKALPVTCSKDYAMIELWDDRCVRVIPNTGEVHGTAD